MGLAITGYLLILAWQSDYGQNPTVDDPLITEASSSFDAPAVPDTQDVMSPSAVPGSDYIPQTVNSPSQSVTAGKNQQGLETVRIETDVLEVDISLMGGDIVSVDLPQYPANLNEPDRALRLIDSKNQYASQSGLIGPSGIDKGGIRPNFESKQRLFQLRQGRDELKVTLALQEPTQTGLLVEKVLTFRRGDYLVDIDYVLELSLIHI